MTKHPRILITRLSHIGDCILTLPMACAIKDHDPSAFVAWVVQSPSDQLLANHPAIDQLVVTKPGFLKRPSEIWRLRAELQGLHCDTALDPQSLTKSALLSWMSAAPRRIGFRGKYGREMAPLLNTEGVLPTRSHLVDRSLELLQPLGFSDNTVRFDVPIGSESEEWAAAFVRQTHLGCEFAVINPGAGWMSKRWPPRHFARVARFLGESYRMPSVIVWAGKQERRWAEEIVVHSGGHAILAPATNLRQLAALLRKSLFFIGGDTGPLHIAAAVNTPCVALYGPTRAEESGPYGRRHEIVQSCLSPGSRRERKTSDASIKAIDVHEVTAACDRIIVKLTADCVAA